MKKKDHDTPLHKLCLALCSEKTSKFFENQVVMYQFIVPFISNQFSFISGNYQPASIDELIGDIKKYLFFMYESMLTGDKKEPDPSEKEMFSNMHRFIYNNAANRDSRPSDNDKKDNLDKAQNVIRDMNYRNMTKEKLEVHFIFNGSSLVNNTNKIIMNHRFLPKKFIDMFNDDTEDYSVILYRCFWLLQYYYVYYGNEGDLSTYSVNRELNKNTSSGIIDYFYINRLQANKVYKSLKTNCGSYSDFFKAEHDGIYSFLSLARIIIDVMIEQMNLRENFSVKKVKSADVIHTNKVSVTEAQQFEDYQSYLGGYGTDSYDRLCLLRMFAPKNCYAAEELATAYYWGKSYVVREKKTYEIEKDYNKAAEWFQKAIELSDPPMQTACWSLGYTLINIRYDTEEENKEAERKAIEYFKLAGDYPAAYNKLAQYMFRDGEKLYSKWKKEENPVLYEDILVQFLSAIRLADEAGKKHWFFGHNQIAIFLMNHRTDKKDEKLIENLKDRLNLSIPFDIESQLKKSASYGNPWALKHLALYKLENGEKQEAKALLEKAAEAGYDAAIYELAMRFYDKGSEKRTELLEKASCLSYPIATYELMLEENDLERKENLKTLCRQQVYSGKKLNLELVKELEKHL